MKTAAFASAALAAYTSIAGGLEPADLTSFFVRPWERSCIVFRAAELEKGAEVPCEIAGYDGNVVRRTTSPVAEDGTVSVEVELPRGYHELRFPSVKQSFGVVSIEPFVGEADAFFAIDSATTWLETREDVRSALVSILARSGVSAARERLSLSSFDAHTGKCDWNDSKRPRGMRALYAKAGVGVLDMVWGANKALDPSPGGSLPYNYVALGDAWRDARTEIGAGWKGYEVGNEPDLEGFPSDQYVAAVKGASLAQDASLPHVPVVGGVFASVPPGDWYSCALENGILECTDAISFHQYDRVPSVEGQVLAMRRWLAAGGHPSKPLVLSESGHFWPLGPDRPDAAHDVDSAAEISAKAVEAKACGVASFYPFVLVFYEEGGIKNFGMFGREVTPTRQFAAYAFCIKALAGRDYAGDLAGVEGLARARVFAGADGRSVAALYTGKPGTAVKVQLPGATAVTSADGSRLVPGADGAYEISDSLAYAFYRTLPPVEPKTLAARLLALSRKPAKALREQSGVVMQYRRRPGTGRVSKRAYSFTKAEASSLPVPVRFQNVGTRSVTVTPRLVLPDGRETALSPVALAPRSSADVEFKVDALAALDVCEIRYIRVLADVDLGAAPLPVALPVTVDGELDEIMGRFKSAKRVPLAETRRWKMRAGAGRHAFSAKDGGTLRVDMDFDNSGASWIYPYYSLPERIDPSRHCGIVVRARIEKDANNVMVILAQQNKGYEVWANDLFAADGQWHSVYIPFEGLHYHTTGMQNAQIDFAAVDAVSVGCCSRTSKNALEVSDFYFVERQK